MKAEEFGKILRNQRERSGLTRSDLAQRLGLKASKQIERYESGVLFPDVEKIYQLSDIFKTDLFSLLTRKSGGDSNLNDIAEKLRQIEYAVDSNNRLLETLIAGEDSARIERTYKSRGRSSRTGKSDSRGR